MEKKETKSNKRKLENLVIIFLVVIYLILSEGVNIFSIIFNIPFIIIGFCLFYFIFLIGLKLFKIENVSKNKIYIYIFSILILDLASSSLFTFFELFQNNIFVFHTFNFITYSIFTVIFFKYYFLFSVRKTLQLFLYLTILSFILITLINKLFF